MMDADTRDYFMSISKKIGAIERAYDQEHGRWHERHPGMAICLASIGVALILASAGLYYKHFEDTFVPIVVAMIAFSLTWPSLRDSPPEPAPDGLLAQIASDPSLPSEFKSSLGNTLAASASAGVSREEIYQIARIHARKTIVSKRHGGAGYKSLTAES